MTLGQGTRAASSQRSDPAVDRRVTSREVVRGLEAHPASRDLRLIIVP